MTEIAILAEYRRNALQSLVFSKLPRAASAMRVELAGPLFQKPYSRAVSKGLIPGAGSAAVSCARSKWFWHIAGVSDRLPPEKILLWREGRSACYAQEHDDRNSSLHYCCTETNLARENTRTQVRKGGLGFPMRGSDENSIRLLLEGASAGDHEPNSELCNFGRLI